MINFGNLKLKMSVIATFFKEYDSQFSPQIRSFVKREGDGYLWATWYKYRDRDLFLFADLEFIEKIKLIRVSRTYEYEFRKSECREFYNNDYLSMDMYAPLINMYNHKGYIIVPVAYSEISKADIKRWTYYSQGVFRCDQQRVCLKYARRSCVSPCDRVIKDPYTVACAIFKGLK